jgi:hypothetical protein
MIIEVNKGSAENVEQIKVMIYGSEFIISEGDQGELIVNKIFGKSDSNIWIKPRSGNAIEVK